MKLNTYVDYSINWCGPNYADIANESDYNIATVCFYVYDRDPQDFLKQLLLDKDGPAKEWVQNMHTKGIKILLCWGGATGLPRQENWYELSKAVDLANKLANIVELLNLDGVDVDWEDDYTNGNPGLCGFGNEKVPGTGPAIPWLIHFTTELRKLLASNKTISHAPQGPYFPLGYGKIHESCGDCIDFYNVQFYNQGQGTYTSYDQLFETSDLTSIHDLVVKYKIPEAKILVGKPQTKGDVTNGGYIEPNQFCEILKKGLCKFPKLGGVSSWMWHRDDPSNKEFSEMAAKAWK